jgi:hypothetical protein
MPSLRELTELFNEGALGLMLAERFHGQIGHTYPMKDSEFMVGFASEPVTPSGKEIGQAVVGFYSGLGYRVEVKKDPDPDVFMANIYSDGRFDGPFLVNITTKYPLTISGPLNHLRVTTTTTL